ncbi:DEHA2D06600p [Debaryomyces hansenii CBS767]|uniref:Pre-rRNA-processing protein ESF2 n=1 Tax=Debaryomyces hansenii (strain ATCC 36239 / CBS 767 / BCRC 21394 / JCM 1990 / NBRC 0083 / IGC 2968) TaxID=284592 RepID=ESF2_DEBHA|nr:DEHA2D06600p [Debaryomyces hansenii CBS767]Q6BSS5.2 RecName: Full=Pre-rRNA-processing protein ESF2; AltName: Full=18S rRNA factor 2 [Debaryomyces hansenii CBS767]CAG86889.2 DEHA2D06600p [Debaryomyces hansenii CBS767]|eukprot:XP_458745.2 DEHA2D06600p [Debaryomyces hansenii CBS767]
MIQDESDLDDFEDDEEDDEDEKVFNISKKASHIDNFKNEESEDEEDLNEEDDDLFMNTDIIDEETIENSKQAKNINLKKLTPEQLAKEQKKIKKTGVCYLSKIPPYMKPAKLRSVLSRFGKIDRLFLKPEDNSTYTKRVKYGGNKKKNYTAGWVEFINKKDAKLCAGTLNGNKLGGKKSSYYYDDIINIKYLSAFKWFDLTQQIAKENEIRQAKLSMELSQQQKLNKSFINNVEKSKMINNMQNKRKARQAESGADNSNKEESDIRRNLKQRKLASTRADAEDELKHKSKPNEKLNDVLSKVF